MQLKILVYITYKKFKKRKGYNSASKKRLKNLLYFSFFKTLVTQNHNLAFSKGFYLRQAVIVHWGYVKAVMIKNVYLLNVFKGNLTPVLTPVFSA